MDLHHTAACIALLRELAHAGATVIVAMHDLSLATVLADHVWLLDGGEAVASGPMREVLTPERLRAVFRTEFEWIQPPQGPARLLAQLHATDRGTSTTIEST
jgi:iron complex transport system ATP-binding protein